MAMGEEMIAASYSEVFFQPLMYHSVKCLVYGTYAYDKDRGFQFLYPGS
jgi:hypothetical protein